MRFLGLLGLSLAFAGTNPVGTQVAQDKERGFSLTIPNSWEKQMNSYGSAMIVLSPQENQGDTFRENINVVVEQLNTPSTSKAYFDASQGLIKKAFTDFALEKTGTSKIGNQEFFWSIFTHRLGKVKARVLQYVMVSGKRAFVLTASAQPEKFVKFRNDFETIIHSFRIDGPPGKVPASIK